MSIEVVDLLSPPSSPVGGTDDDGSAVRSMKMDERNPTTTTDYNSDGLTVEEQPTKKTRVVPSDSGLDGDDDCFITGSSGTTALVDFAHARWNCAKHPMGKVNAARFCQNCFCVICDVPAAQCVLWEQHCFADPYDPEVKRQRAFVLKKGAMPARQCTLQQLKQVYPTEVNVVLKGIVLKTYQRQVISWMLTNERDGVRVADIVQLKEEDVQIPAVYGGFLSLEMGMGKTACTIATCKANLMPTLIVAPALTCVQWSHQFSQYAPELSNAMLYCSSQSRQEETLLQTDIIVVNSTSSLLESVMKRVRRVVVDESHEVLAKGGGAVVKFLHNLSYFPNVRVLWLVSGTPFGNSERIDDSMFARQMRILLKHHRDVVIRHEATTADVQKLVMRMEKKQTINDANGSTVTVMPIADIEYKTLQVALSTAERELYNIAACMDGWTESVFTLCGKRSDDISAALDFRFKLRQLILGERIDEFEEAAEKRLTELFYAADSEAPDLFYAKVDRMTHRIKECCKKLRNSSSKIDAVLDEIESLRRSNPDFKAVIISESDGAGRYIKNKLGDNVGIMQRAKGRTSVREQKVLLAFQEGKFDVLVCSFESVRIGTNLDQAGAIYFVDTSIHDTEYKQACNRISRCGTKHSSLTATFVYVRETLSEEIYKYHEDRRAGKTIEQAAARFEGDDVHDYSPARDFYRMQHNLFDQMTFSYQRKPDSTLHDLFTSDMSIDDMFDMICDAQQSTDEYEISLKFKPNKRPACYDVAQHITVQLKTDGLVSKIVFDVPQHAMDGKTEIHEAEVLTAVVKLNQAQAKVVESTIHDWHRTWMRPAMLRVRMQLRSGTIMELFNIFGVIRASCSSCKWCGWRTIHNYDAPFSGSYTKMEDTATKVPIANEKLMTVSSVNGALYGKIRCDVEGRMATGDGFAPVTDKLRDYIEKARESKKQMGVVPFNLRYDMLTPRFFEERSDVYKKALVKLEGANINDTIRFQYKDREYETFIREIVPTGLDWYAVAYVVESEKPDSTIVIERHDFVDMKRVVPVGNDAYSIKDIIRLVQQQRDSAKTAELKAIIRRADITDAKKLELASALV